MFGKELIKSLGTPEAKQHMVEILAPAVLLVKDTDEVWRVADARKVKTTQFEYNSLEDALSDFEGEVFAADSKFCLLTKSEDYEIKELLKNYWTHSTALEELNQDKNILTKFTYQLLSIEKLIPSLLEPFPVEILLNILIDSLGEVFTASAAAYACTGTGKIKKVGSTGHQLFPEIMDKFGRCYPGSVVKDERYLVSSISEDDKEQYFIIFKRETPFQEEEISILRTVTSLLQKSRYLIKEQTRHQEIESLVSQFEFILEILKNFSVAILSTFEESKLSKNICDAIKEMFQAEFVVIYERMSATDRFKMNYSVDLGKRVFPDPLIYGSIVETGKQICEVPFDYQKCFGIKTESGLDFLIFIGESVLENYYKKEIISVLDDIVPAEIKRAYSNVDAVKKIQEQSEYIQRIVTEMGYLAENLQEIEQVKDTDHLIEQLNMAAENTTGAVIKEVHLYKPVEKTDSGKKIVIGEPSAPLGHVVYEKAFNEDLKDAYLLSFLSQIGLQTQEKINVFEPGKGISSFENIVVDFLKVKYRLSGLSGMPSVFRLDLSELDERALEGYGVGLKVGDSLFFATYLSSEDLNSVIG